MFALSESVELFSAVDRVCGDDERFDVGVCFRRPKRLLETGDSGSSLPAFGLEEVMEFSQPGLVGLDGVGLAHFLDELVACYADDDFVAFAESFCQELPVAFVEEVEGSA